jgi:chromatin segregation and condensation protein Rec8/ScpA/Scc1 (kleisin family)
MKMAEVAHLLAHSGAEGLAFDSLFTLPCARYDIVITFLAVLELLRSGRALARQAAVMATIYLFPATLAAMPGAGR